MSRTAEHISTTVFEGGRPLLAFGNGQQRKGQEGVQAVLLKCEVAFTRALQRIG